MSADADATIATIAAVERPFALADKKDLSEIAGTDDQHVATLMFDARQLPSDNHMVAVKVIDDAIDVLNDLKARRCRADVVRVVCDKNVGFLARVASIVSAAVRSMCPATLALDFGNTTLSPTYDLLHALCSIDVHVDHLVIRTPSKVTGSSWLRRGPITDTARIFLHQLRPSTIKFFAPSRHMALVQDIATCSPRLDKLHVCMCAEPNRRDIPVSGVERLLGAAKTVIMTDIKVFNGAGQEHWANVQGTTLILTNCTIEAGMVCVAKCAARSVGCLVVAFHAKSSADYMQHCLRDFGAQMTHECDLYNVIVDNTAAPVGPEARPADVDARQDPLPSTMPRLCPPPAPLSAPSTPIDQPIPSPTELADAPIAPPAELPTDAPSETGDAPIAAPVDTPVELPPDASSETGDASSPSTNLRHRLRPRTRRGRAVVEPVPHTRPSVTSDATLDSDFDSDLGAMPARRPRRRAITSDSDDSDESDYDAPSERTRVRTTRRPPRRSDTAIAADITRAITTLTTRTAADVDAADADDDLFQTLVLAMDAITALSRQLVAKRMRRAD